MQPGGSLHLVEFRLIRLQGELRIVIGRARNTAIADDRHGSVRTGADLGSGFHTNTVIRIAAPVAPARAGHRYVATTRSDRGTRAIEVYTDRYTSGSI